MTIRLYNTKTRSKEAFEPLDAANVRMYVCGPTVYDRAHIGNARPVVVFDVLYRLLRHEYGEKSVTYVRNFTDVDDKINAKAAETVQPGETLEQAVKRITDETIGWYHEDMDALGALRPDHEPRATEFIDQMVKMIEALIAKGHAYEAEGHVLFEARTDPDYGCLSRRPLDEMKAGARVEVAPYKRDPMDSVMWKPSTGDQPGWDSPWGRGRPGWHIECSAMAGDLLGEAFDIHGGGIDLQFPHHENEWAQSRCMGHAFASVWMHNGYLMVEGEKMSKSLGNFFTVADLREKGVPGEVMRLAMLMTHYRSPLDWTEKAVGEAEKALRKWRELTAGVVAGEVSPLVLEALADDLNTSLAISELHKLANSDDKSAFRASAELLGLLTPELGVWEWQVPTKRVVKRLIPTAFSDNPKRETAGELLKRILKPSEDLRKLADPLGEMREALYPLQSLERALGPTSRIAETFNESVTRLNRTISTQKKLVSDFDVVRRAMSNPVTDFLSSWDEFENEYNDVVRTADPETPIIKEIFVRAREIDINAIISERTAARSKRDFQRADDLRHRAEEAGFVLIDSKDGTRWGVSR